jgi:hypothetical protein
VSDAADTVTDMGPVSRQGGVPGAGLRQAVIRGALRRRIGPARSVPFAPTALDDELLAAVDEAVVRRCALGVVLPVHGTPAAILLGTATLVGAIRRTGSLDVEVAVVSPRLSARTLYEDLTLDGQRISEFIPRTSLGRDGLPRIAGRTSRATGGRLHIANDLSRVRGSLDRLQGIVIDALAATPSELGRLLTGRPGVPIVYLTADPFDPGLGRIRAVGGLVWGWDAQSLAALTGPACPERVTDAGPLLARSDVLAVIAAAPVTIWEPDPGRGGGLDDAMRVLWQSLWQLSRAYATAREEYGASDAMRWAWGVYGILALLPVRPTDYDWWVGGNPYAIRLGQAPQTARAYAANVTGVVRDAWRVFGSSLQEALAAAGGAEKLIRLQAWVNERGPEPGLLVARNRMAGAAIMATLDESPATRADWRGHMKIATLQDLTTGRIPLRGLAEICLPGPIQRSRAGLLAMPPGASLMVIAAGPFEARRITGQVVSARAALAAIRAETVRSSARELDIVIPARPAGDVHEPEIRIYRAGSSRSVGHVSAESGQNPWEPFDADVLAVLQRRIGDGTDDAAAPPARFVGGTASATVPVIVISLGGPDGGTLLADANDVVARQRDGMLARVAMKSLRAGDVIYLVDRNARRDLFTAMTDKLSEAQAYTTLANLIDFWHGRAARLRDAGMTYEEIHRRMGGTAITSAPTIGTWIRGDRDGPKDQDDVARFARAVGDEALLEEAERVGWALKTLHIVHRKAGRWLSSRISGAQLRQADAFVDQNLGIRVTDLLEAVATCTVEAVDLTPRTAPASALGVVLTDADATMLLRQPSDPAASWPP